MMDSGSIESKDVKKIQRIKVFSPATIANVGCGYDIMGFALEDLGETITVCRSDRPGLHIESISGGFDLPMEADKNLATIAASALLEKAGFSGLGFTFKLEKNIHPGSGLGTSASSSAGAVYAVNRLIGSPFSEFELIEFAMEGERMISGKAHADNVAPAILGGFVVVRSYEPMDIIKIRIPNQLHVSIVHPQIQVKTLDAKRMLKKSIDLQQAVIQWGNVAGMIAGLCSGDLELVKRSMQDEIAEPVRSLLIPYYNQVKEKALNAGAYGCNIAGSGPSIFAFSESEEKAHEIMEAMLSVYRKKPVTARSFVSKIGSSGVKEI